MLESHPVRSIPIALINITTKHDVERFRTHISAQKIHTMAFSISQHGLLQPIIVRESPTKPGSFDLVAGETRLKACLHLGLSHIDATLISDLSDDELREIELEENVVRTDLPLADLVKAHAELFERKKRQHERQHPVILSAFNRYTQGAYAEHVNLSEATVSNYLKLADGLKEYPTLIEDGGGTIRGALNLLYKYEREVVPDESPYLLQLRETFLHGQPYDAFQTLRHESVDLLLADVTEPYRMPEFNRYISAAGQGFIFLEASQIKEVTDALRTSGFNFNDSPYIAATQPGNTYFMYLWFARTHRNPPDALTHHTVYRYESSPLSGRIKPYNLFKTLILETTRQGNLVFSPLCYSLALSRAAVDNERQVLSFCPNKTLLESQFLNANTEKS